MTSIRIGELFTGYGGLTLAATLALPNVEITWFAENNRAANSVLATHWPHVENHGDVSHIDYTTVAPVDLLVGGFPCQDISHIGTHKGIDGERSRLWTHFAHAIRILRPRYALIENVGALTIRGLDHVLADIAHCGLNAEWTTIRASDIGAPHRRERLFILAATPHAHSIRPIRPRQTRHRRPRPAHNRCTATENEWGKYATAIDTWAGIIGRDPPISVLAGSRGDGEHLSAEFVEWLMGLPAGHVTNVNISRSAKLELLGNGVVPQQAAFALTHLLSQQGSDDNE